MKFPLLPPQASSMAGKVDALYFALIGICGLVIIGILAAILYFLVSYRRGKPADRRPVNIPTTPLELTWTIIPLIFFMGIFVWGAIVYKDLQTVPAGTIELNVIGKQWMWKVQHASGKREINELHVPVGEVVKLTLASQDVIHSFYIPAFRIKKDVVPGRIRTDWFQATRVGTYHLFCAEYCGTDHSFMRGRVIVMRPDDYENWLVRGAPSEPLARAGERLFLALGCSGCHLGSGIVRAPRLEGIYGNPVPLQDGRVVLADEAYIRDSILLPQKDIAAGYEAVMPSFQGQITEEQIFELIAYIKSLGTRKAEDLEGAGKL